MPDEASDMAPHLMNMIALLEPVFEAGTGLRVKLEAEGWSPTIAEALSHQLISGIIAKMLAG